MPNDQTIAGIQQIKDGATARAIRFIWDQLQSLTKAVKQTRQGTLNPDQRPRLSPAEAGTEFFSTDFNRAYRWTGSRWEDAPSAPARWQVSTFARPPEPSVGWILCDGRSGNISTSAGGTTYVSTPSIPVFNGLSSYLRA